MTRQPRLGGPRVPAEDGTRLMQAEVELAIKAFADLVQEDESDFRVHSSVYRDPRVFDVELQQIFERSWVYVGHESQIAHEGDYVTSRIGSQPVIVTRSKEGGINVLLNVCRHRANALCREERGNSLNFRCPYHGWTYTNTGQLIGVSDRPRYPEGFTTDGLDLMHAPSIGSYRGLIFASLKADVSGLAEHLAPVKAHIDLWADRSLEGDPTVLLPHRYGYQGNWKFQAENGVDGYHPGITHESAFSSLASFGIGTGRETIKRGHVSRGFPGGHSTIEGGYDDARGIAPGVASLFEKYLTSLTQHHGKERAQEIITNRHLYIFPNVFIMDDLIRVIQPISVELSEVYSYPIRLGGVSDEYNSRRLYDTTLALSTTGLLNPADLEMFASNQTGLRARDMEWLQLSRGMGQEDVLPSGERVGVLADEAPQRAFYRHWAVSMSEHASAR